MGRGSAYIHISMSYIQPHWMTQPIHKAKAKAKAKSQHAMQVQMQMLQHVQANNDNDPNNMYS